MRVGINVLASTVTAVALAHNITETSGIKVAIQARAVSGSDICDYFQSLNQTLLKYGARPLPSYDLGSCETQLLRRRASTRVALDRVVGVDRPGGWTVTGNDGRYVGFETLFDTGSSRYSVPGPFCGAAQDCSGDIKYDNGGLLLGTQSQQPYVNAASSGDDFVDTISVGDVMLPGCHVLSLRTAHGVPKSNGNTSAIMGLRRRVTIDEPFSFFEILTSMRPDMASEISFYYGGPLKSDDIKAKLLLSGRNENHFTSPLITIQTLNQYA